MKPDVILCHYGEIGLKGKNRGYFENKLIDNLRSTLQRYSPDTFSSIGRMFGRLIIRLNDHGQNEIDSINSVLKNVCGMVYFAPAIKVDQDREKITKLAVKLMSVGDYNSFRVTTRRTDKDFTVSKQK